MVLPFSHRITADLADASTIEADVYEATLAAPPSTGHQSNSGLPRHPVDWQEEQLPGCSNVPLTDRRSSSRVAPASDRSANG
jgi:hypothetical protein